MRIFAKLVLISLFFSALSLLLFLASFHAPEDVIYIYITYAFIIVAGISFFVAGTITEPVRELREGFEKLMKDETAEVRVKSGDELEELANTFNYMARIISKQREELRKSEERFRNLVEDVNDWVFELDEKMRFTYSSPKVKDVLGYEVDEVIGKNFIEFLRKPPDKLNGKVELEFIAKDGKIVPAEVSFRAFSGSSSGYRAVCRDITHRKKAEEKLRYLASIVENVVDAVISLDPKGRIKSWNRGAELMFGFKARDVIGKHYSIIVPGSQREMWENKLRTLKGFVRFESSGIRVDGTKIQMEVTLTKLSDVVVIARDVTHRKEAEEKLRKAYRKLEERTAELVKSRKELEYLANIVENSNDAIYSVNLSGRITSWNRTAERLFGWSKEEAIGMHADVLLPDELKGETELILRKMFEGITSMMYETKRLCKDGKTIEVEVTVSPIYHGELKGYSVIARDISLKVEAESRILRRVLKYDLERGKIYLTTDRALAVEIVEDFLKCGCNAAVISRYVEVKGARNYRLSEKKSRDFVYPTSREIERLILSFPGWNNVILVELDYMLMRDSFENVLKFVQELRDTLHILGKGVVLLSVDPELIGERELRLLAKECEFVKAKPSQHTIPAKCYEILRYAYMQNRVGESVSFAELMNIFNMSRNTVKKYVRQLESMGLVKVVKDGRYKVVVPTQKGKELFTENYEVEFI